MRRNSACCLFGLFGLFVLVLAVPAYASAQNCQPSTDFLAVGVRQTQSGDFSEAAAAFECAVSQDPANVAAVEAWMVALLEDERLLDAMEPYGILLMFHGESLLSFIDQARMDVQDGGSASLTAAKVVALANLSELGLESDLALLRPLMFDTPIYQVIQAPWNNIVLARHLLERAARTADPDVLGMAAWEMANSLGDYDTAIEWIDQAIERDPDSGYLYVIRSALVATQQRDIRAAQDDLDRASDLQPLNPLVNAAAWSTHLVTDPEAAIEYVERTAASAPEGDFTIAVMRYTTYTTLSDDARAYDAIADYVESHSGDYERVVAGTFHDGEMRQAFMPPERVLIYGVTASAGDQVTLSATSVDGTFLVIAADPDGNGIRLTNERGSRFIAQESGVYTFVIVNVNQDQNGVWALISLDIQAP